MSQFQIGDKLKHVNHVVYLVKDMNKALGFYRDFLGIKQIPKMVDNPDIVWLQLPSGVMLHLIETDELAPFRQHVAFEVLSDAELDDVKQTIDSADIEIIEQGARNDGQRYLFCRDPDGNRVEICAPCRF
tara:strand:- start:14 stop:403 length:390 start_codon:yes stop_codon:yes gene_type:complete